MRGLLGLGMVVLVDGRFASGGPLDVSVGIADSENMVLLVVTFNPCQSASSSKTFSQTSSAVPKALPNLVLLIPHLQ